MTAPPYAAVIVLGPLPTTLSPTRIATFTECPRRFQYVAVDHLEEPPSTWTLKGNLVHAALEALFLLQPQDRTRHAADVAVREAAASEWFAADAATVGLDASERAAFVGDANALVDAYFRMEDPTAVDAVGVELRVAAELTGKDGPLSIRGVIDRLDRSPSGELVVVDYKTGRAPRAGHERERLAAVETYALLCERVLGVRPSLVRLMYLRDELVVERAISELEVRRQERRALGVWDAVRRAHAAGAFRPVPSRLCAYCAFADRCEAAMGVTAATASIGSPARARGR